MSMVRASSCDRDSALWLGSGNGNGPMPRRTNPPGLAGKRRMTRNADPGSCAPLRSRRNPQPENPGSWRGLQSGALTPDDSRLITPETTPPSIPTNPATAPEEQYELQFSKLYGA